MEDDEGGEGGRRKREGKRYKERGRRGREGGGSASNKHHRNADFRHVYQMVYEHLSRVHTCQATATVCRKHSPPSGRQAATYTRVQAVETITLHAHKHQPQLLECRVNKVIPTPCTFRPMTNADIVSILCTLYTIV